MQTGRTEKIVAAVRTGLADGGARLPAWQILAVLCAISGAMIVVLGTRLTFFNDEFYVLFQRPGLTAESIFKPHNQHIAVLPVLVYKAFVAVFGFGEQLPFRLALAAVVVSLAVLVFVFVRDRAGQMLALLAAAALLFLGPAWEDLLWSFQIGLIGSLAAGVGVLIAMERQSPQRDALACGLLLISVLASDLGIPFLVAGGLAVLLRRRPNQLWIPGVPAIAFAIWWFTYGNDAKSSFSAGAASRVPVYVLDSISAGLASLAGLTQEVGGASGFAWGRALLVVCVVGTVAWLLRGGRPTRYSLVIASAGITFWALAGANFIRGREPEASRYQLVSATFLILFAAEFFRPVRLRPRALAAITALALITIASNIEPLRDGYNTLRLQSAITSADLGALEITRPHAPPTYQLIEAVAHSPYLSGVTAKRYFEETDAHGSLGDSPQEIATAPPEEQQAADNVLAAGYQMGLKAVPQAEGALDVAGCRTLKPGSDGGPLEAVMPTGGATITNLGPAPVSVGVRRFAPQGMPVNLGIVNSSFSARVDIPADSLARRWYLEANGDSALAVCP